MGEVQGLNTNLPVYSYQNNLWTVIWPGWYTNTYKLKLQNSIILSSVHVAMNRIKYKPDQTDIKTWQYIFSSYVILI